MTRNFYRNDEAMLVCQDISDVRRQAAREAVLHGDGHVMTLPARECPHCAQHTEPVWFGSLRAWVCPCCNNEISAAAPTAEQRRARHPCYDLQTKLIENFERPFPGLSRFIP